MFGISFTSFGQLRSNAAADPVEKVVKFYPNPASASINFELPGAFTKAHSLQLFNFMGKKVREINISTQRINVSLDGFYRGVYIYQLRDRYGKVVDSGRFQVVR